MGVSDLQGAKIHTIPTTRITYFVTEYQQNAQFYVIVRDRSSWIEAFAPRVIFLRRDLSPQAVWHNYGSPCSLPLSSGEPCDHLLRPEAAILIARRREREARHIDDVSIARFSRNSLSARAVVRSAHEAIFAARSGDTAWAEERSALAAANDDDMTRDAEPSALIGPLPYAECGHREEIGRAHV